MKPRLGFVGLGWVGRQRLETLAAHGGAEIVAVADPSRERREVCVSLAPGARACEHLGQLLELPLDAVVIATPSALHVEHCLAVLERGRAVLCQRPLGRTAGEARRVVEAARACDRLLAVDLPYRHTEAMQRVREVVSGGGIGRPFALELVFHDAYGLNAPASPDRAESGGGCVIDLGLHLVDLALWLTDFAAVEAATSRLFAAGELLVPGDHRVEDYAEVQLHLGGGIVARLACSWRLSAGRDAVIGAAVYGTAGGVAMRNLDGSTYDLVAERYDSTRTARLASPPDAWAGRAAVAWLEQLARGEGFDPQVEQVVAVARTIDTIYQRGAA